MRQLVENKVVFDFERGLRDIGLSYVRYARHRGNVPALVNCFVNEEGDPEVTDIRKLVKELTDEELLQALDTQACENYR